MSEEKQKYPIQIIRGQPFPFLEHFTKKNIEDAMDFVPEDGDLVIASYPKTGTNWMTYIVLQILSKGESYPSFNDSIYKVVPCIEMVGVAAVHAQEKPRFYRSHIAYDFLQKNDKSKVIYIYRHPEDVLASRYPFVRNLELEFREFNHFFDDSVSGNVAYGNYFEHVLSFYGHREDNNLLMVSYEKLQANRKDEILRIAKFLGDEHYQCLVDDDEILNSIILHTSFDYMKKNLFFNHPDFTSRIRLHQPEDKAVINFFRKGIVGDGKATLTSSQRQILKENAARILRGTSVISEWYSDEI